MEIKIKPRAHSKLGVVNGRELSNLRRNARRGELEAGMRLRLVSVCALVLGACAPSVDAFRVTVRVERARADTCYELSVSSDNEVLSSVRFPKEEAQLDYTVAIARGTFPREVSVQAHALTGGGCEAAAIRNGTSASVSAAFDGKAVTPVVLVVAGEDADGDGYLSTQSGGEDCDDVNGEIHPAHAENCESPIDHDCNGLAGCLDLACSAVPCTGPPAALALVSPPETLNYRDCALIAVNVVDAQGRNVAPPPQSFLNMTGPFQMFFDDRCTQEALGVVLRPMTQVYLKPQQVGQVVLQVSSGNLSAAEQTVVVRDDRPAAVGFLSSPFTVAAGSCAGPVLLQVLATDGLPTPPGPGITFNLSSDVLPPFGYFRDSACTEFVSDLTADAVVPTAGPLYFRGTKSGSWFIQAIRPPFANTQQMQTVTAGPVDAIEVIGPAEVRSGRCSPSFQVSLSDAFGNSVTTSQISVTGSAGLTVYTDNNCRTEGSANPFSVQAARNGTYSVTVSAGNVIKIFMVRVT
jgi:hypothetical protein